MTAENPRLYLATDLVDVECCRFAAGTACVYTHRAPDKDSDNEDSAALIPCGTGAGVLAIADGLGGLPAGNQASEQAVRQLSISVSASCGNSTALREAILDGIEQANSRIIGLGLGAARGAQRPCDTGHPGLCRVRQCHLHESKRGCRR